MHINIVSKIGTIIYKASLLIIEVIVICTIIFFSTNALILSTTQNSIIQSEELGYSVDAVLILGASVQWLQLSPILQDRVETAIQLYQRQKALKIIVSWDNGKRYYNEVDAMYTYLINRGIPSQDIILDTWGYNTFLSIANTKKLTWIQTIAISTQEFHLPRAIFIAQSLWFNVLGIISDRASYDETKQYKLRESFARIKAVWDVLWWKISNILE